MEYNDIYDINRKRTGAVHRRGASWGNGEYGLIVCVWVYDGHGNLLLTKRAPGKSAAGTWENSGGAVRAGEDSRTAIARELFEETGICADRDSFELLSQCTDTRFHYDHYCLRRFVPLDQIVLQPGETVDAQWADFNKIHKLIDEKQMCYVIGRQFCKLENLLRRRQND